MGSTIRIASFFIISLIIFKLLTNITGTIYYYDIFIPIIPFFALLNNNNIIIVLFIIISFISSIIHYDEIFATMFGYGVSLMLLIIFSKKYSLVNIVNYLISVVAISLIIFIVMMLAYFVKDKIIVFQELYQFVLMNLIVGFLFYIAYRIAKLRRVPENVKR